ncbi:MAG: IS630 family transposase [Roseateles sp.]
MGRPYSEDLRERIVAAVEGGHSRRAAARMFGVSASCAVKLLRRWRETGSVKPGKTGGSKGSKLEAHGEWLLASIKEKPDLTLQEIQARLRTERAAAVSIGSIWNFFDRRDISLKKTAHAAEQERPDVAAARAAWRDWQASLDPARLVFIDETGASTAMARRRGRAKRGERVVAPVPHGHWKTTTFVAGLRLTGLSAPFVIDQPMNAAIFQTYLERCLVPTLRPGDMVFMDNLSSHKGQAVAKAITARKATLHYLPSYSPDLNPIEQAFAKLKALLRKAAERSIEALWRTIGRLLDRFTPEECRNYFQNAGYASR